VHDAVGGHGVEIGARGGDLRVRFLALFTMLLCSQNTVQLMPASVVRANQSDTPWEWSNNPTCVAILSVLAGVRCSSLA
jgi:hypothetical protein